MEAISAIKTKNYETKAKRLLAINGYSKNYYYNPHNVRAYAIHNEYGVFCIAIGSNIQEALDNAVDCGLMDSCLDHDCDDPCYLGNAGEPFNLDCIGVYCEYSQY